MCGSTPSPSSTAGTTSTRWCSTTCSCSEDLLVGEEGRGWVQTGNELSYERAGPERLLSSWLLVEEFVRGHQGTALGETASGVLGWAISRYWGIRQLSLAVARMIDTGGAPAVESALVKEMATRFEQDVIQAVSELVRGRPDPGVG